ncbi:hypothetical protein E3N88_43077 [Mikania micrantha]|uniref:Rho-GAP domain-containing protein n=1 Tax=Mikania micrantha TaxID=192012 RepID=A0A5N6LFZ4_9ASTR|nr:hypothetical protein E3N88_43077 [Mikania micrantha]
MSASFTRPRIGATNTVFKSGHLFISSKGLGWKSWKKRWFILTRTSLVFFKTDPSAIPQRESEVDLTLGGIDLNNSGSVVVREDKKLLTVLFPDGRDGRAFTLKAETTEDLYEWKTALEHALAQAPNAALVMGQNGIFRNDTTDSYEGSFCQYKRPVKSLVVGRPILLALEDIDGGPSFLEKALRFLETHGSKVEGILRQSADVEEVDRRVQEYETGNTEFSSDEDAHVIGDCIKHVLRELPSSPVPASCCTALLEAYKIEQKEARVSAMRAVIFETFPEPNRRLLQRILKMMHTISLNTSENRMTASAVAACMAPLLLRPLLAGECEMDDDFDDNLGNSAQLLAAANAANNAQAIIATLLEEYENIFIDDAMLRCSISADSLDISASEDSTDDENMEIKNNIYHDAENEADQESDDDPERIYSGKLSESSGYAGSDLYDFKAYGADASDVVSPRNNVNSAAKSKQFADSEPLEDSNVEINEQKMLQNAESEIRVDVHQSLSGLESSIETPASKLTGSNPNSRRTTFSGRNNGRKTPSVNSADSSGEEELAIQRLELAKNDLKQKLANEVRGNTMLQASLERRKQTLHERRLALEEDVSRLQEQLQAERELKSVLEVGLSISSGQVSQSHNMDAKTRAELEEIALAEADVARLKQKVAELHQQLHQQRHRHYGYLSDASDRHHHLHNHNSHQRVFQQDFDSTIAYINHERKQRSEETSMGAELRNIKGQTLINGNTSRQPARGRFLNSTGLRDPKSNKTFAGLSMDDFEAPDSASMPSTSRPAEMEEILRNLQLLSNGHNRNENDSGSHGNWNSNREETREGRLSRNNNRFSKFEFPKFDGKDVEGWIYKCEHFFTIDETPERLKVRYAAVHLEGRALQWHQSRVKFLGISLSEMNWNDYVRSIEARFAGMLIEDAMSDLKALTQYGEFDLLEDYCDKFDLLLNKVNICQEYAISLFLEGLKPEIGSHVRMFRPTTLKDAYSLSRMQNHANTVTPNNGSKFGNHVKGNSSMKTMSSSTTLNNASKLSLLPTPLKSLPAASVSSSKNNGHNCKNRQLFLFEIIEEEEGIQANDDSVKVIETEIDPQISLHAITGIPSYSTMKIVGAIGTKPLQILIDSGSTHNFLNDTLAEKLKCSLQNVKNMPVTIAYGNKLPCMKLCKDFQRIMQGNWFKADMLVIPLSTYDIVLAAQNTIIEQMTKELLDSGVIRNNTSSFAAHVVRSMQHHLKDLQEVQSLMRVHSLKAKSSKCTFGGNQVEYLGHIIFEKGFATDPKKIQAIVEWTVPTTINTVKRIFGTCRKLALSSSPVLALPDFSKQFVVETDALAKGLGVVLMQDNHPIAFIKYDYEIVYKGKENSVADALSRVQGLALFTMSISSLHPMLWQRSQQGWQHYSVLKSDIIQICHSSPAGGHSGYKRTLFKVQEMFYWKGCAKDVHRYVKECNVYQRIKYETIATPGLLQPLPVPQSIFTDISMDFISGLPKVNGKNTIFVVVDRLTKFGHFIPLGHPFDAAQLAQVFFWIISTNYMVVPQPLYRIEILYS